MEVVPTWFARRISNGKKEIYDPVRRHYVRETPEELVRQAYLCYLVEKLHFPKICLSVEKKVTYNSLTRRYDIVAYSRDAHALLLVECKSEQVELSGDTLYQAAMYNHELQADYVVLFNGKRQVVCQNGTAGYSLIENLPDYKEIVAAGK